MNKKDFLTELEKRIRVLEKNEIKDILNEYSQHIDMSMQEGMSEAEAIKDFGDLDELGAEILEAYHVNPEYEREEAFETTEETKVIYTESGTKKFGKTLKKGFCTMGRGIKSFFLAIGMFFKKLFTREKKEVTPEELAFKAEKKELKKAKKEERKSKSVFSGFWRKVGIIIFVCIMIFLLIPVAIAVFMSVFGSGMALVLVLKGYPLIGVTLAGVGASLMSIAVFILIINAISNKTKRRNKAVEAVEYKEETEEPLYEETEETEDEKETNSFCKYENFDEKNGFVNEDYYINGDEEK